MSNSSAVQEPAEILAVIPARAGSKGIPNKNLRLIGGMTIVGRACEVAARCPSITWVVVSSDSIEIGAAGLEGGANSYVRRPQKLATDTANSADTWAHAWLAAEDETGRTFDTSVLLQPTSPTRQVNDVEMTIATMTQQQAPAALTVSPVPGHLAPHKQVLLTSQGTVKAAVDGWSPNTRRQDVPPSYWLNGLCYAAVRGAFLSSRLVIPESAVAVVIDRPVANIDTLEDLKEASLLLERQITSEDQ